MVRTVLLWVVTMSSAAVAARMAESPGAAAYRRSSFSALAFGATVAASDQARVVAGQEYAAARAANHRLRFRRGSRRRGTVS